MRIIKQLTSNKYLNIKEVFDPEKNCRGYQFAERRGVDSIAFICQDNNTGKFLLNKEYTPPTDEFLVRAFGGSLDKEKDLFEIVIDEVKEEAGYDVSKKEVECVGKVFVSTQMNQYCHLFIVNVTGLTPTGRKPENKMEAMADTVWMTDEEIVACPDWKAISILMKSGWYKE